MGRLSTLIGLLAMSVAVLAITWPTVAEESIPYIEMAKNWLIVALEWAQAHLPF